MTHFATFIMIASKSGKRGVWCTAPLILSLFPQPPFELSSTLASALDPDSLGDLLSEKNQRQEYSRTPTLRKHGKRRKTNVRTSVFDAKHSNGVENAAFFVA
jgi:hypothetical protein